MDILRRRLAERDDLDEADASPYVFPAQRGGGHVGYPQAPWRRILKRVDIKELRPHDLRRSLASWAVGAGASVYAVDGDRGNRPCQTRSRYSPP